VPLSDLFLVILLIVSIFKPRHRVRCGRCDVGWQVTRGVIPGGPGADARQNGRTSGVEIESDLAVTLSGVTKEYGPGLAVVAEVS
jgi:hypothetical protein